MKKKYKTTRIVADFLSPLISEMHLVDSTISEFTINLKNSNTDYFSEFLNLVNCLTKRLDSERINEFSEYFNKLGNNEECIRLQKTFLKSITINNVFEQLLKIIKITETQSIENHFISFRDIFMNLMKEKYKNISRNS